MNKIEALLQLKTLCDYKGFRLIEVDKETKAKFQQEYGYPMEFDILYLGKIKTLFVNESTSTASLVTCIDHMKKDGEENGKN